MTPNELKRTLPISVSLSLEEEMSIVRKWCLWEPKSVGDVCVFDIFDTLTRYPDWNPFESYLVVIEWKHGAWGFRFLYPELVNEDDREWCAFWNSEDGKMWNLKYFRVIGNIHENPELLESPDA